MEPAGGKIPHLPEMAARAGYGHEPHGRRAGIALFHVRCAARCVQFGFQIIQTGSREKGSVAMAWDFMNAFRIIPTDGRPHIAGSIKLFQGDSVGHWEGQTLVVDTTNQNDRTWLDTAGNLIPMRCMLSNASRSPTRIRSATRDHRRCGVATPWKTTETFRRIAAPDYEQLEFACVEGNRDLQHYTEQAGGKAKAQTR